MNASGQNFRKIEHVCGRDGAENPQKGPFHGCCIAMKTLKICNLTTSKAKLMNIPTIVYIHEKFNFTETWGVNYRS